MMTSQSGEAYVEPAKEYAEVEEIAGRIQALRAARSESGGSKRWWPIVGSTPR